MKYAVQAPRKAIISALNFCQVQVAQGEGYNINEGREGTYLLDEKNTCARTMT